MLKTLSEVLAQAEQGGYAVIAPDFPTLYIARILMETAEAVQAPLILSYSTSFKPIRDLRSYAHFVRVVRDEAESYSVPIVFHLDHATNLEDIAEAVDLGFTSVMIDASIEPYAVNLERTLKTVEIAHAAGVSVEAELGHVSSDTDYITTDQFNGFMTDPQEAFRFVQDTDIDALAVAIGTVHGPYKGDPKLDYARLETINQIVSVPLVLHGSSGLSDQHLSRCIQFGIRKINIYTEIIRAILGESLAELTRQTSNPVPVSLAQAKAVQKKLGEYLSYSGSINKGSENIK